MEFIIMELKELKTEYYYYYYSRKLIKILFKYFHLTLYSSLNPITSLSQFL